MYVMDIIRLTINHVLVVVNCSVTHLVVTGDSWVAQVADVDDVGCRVAVGRDTSTLELVDFIVKDDVLLVAAIEDGALVDVSGTCES